MARQLLPKSKPRAKHRGWAIDNCMADKNREKYLKSEHEKRLINKLLEFLKL